MLKVVTIQEICKNFNVVNLTLNSVCIKCIHALFLSSPNLEYHCLSVNLICIGTAGRKMVSS